MKIPVKSKHKWVFSDGEHQGDTIDIEGLVLNPNMYIEQSEHDNVTCSTCYDIQCVACSHSLGEDCW